MTRLQILRLRMAYGLTASRAALLAYLIYGEGAQ